MSVAQTPVPSMDQTEPIAAPSKPAKAKRPPLGTYNGFLFSIFATIAVVCAWFLLYLFILTPFQEARSQTIKYGNLRESLALQTTPIGGAIDPGTPIALIDSPPLGLSGVVVVEGTTSGDLMNGPGHLRNSVLPGQMGVSYLFGRASTFAGSFSKIAQAKSGDLITVTTGQGVFTYAVEGVRKANSPLPQPLTTGKGRMTLVTATGDGGRGSWQPSDALYVDATLKGDAQQYPPGRPYLVTRSELPLQGDPSALLPLALALPLLIGSVVFGLWARNRWGLWQAWLVALPVALASLWAVSQAAVQLLPNLL